jgi:hypothetical protein
VTGINLIRPRIAGAKQVRAGHVTPLMVPVGLPATRPKRDFQSPYGGLQFVGLLVHPVIRYSVVSRSAKNKSPSKPKSSENT